MDVDLSQRIIEQRRLEDTTPTSLLRKRACYSGLCPDSFLTSPGKDTPQSLWAAFSHVQLSSQQRSSSSFSNVQRCSLPVHYRSITPLLNPKNHCHISLKIWLILIFWTTHLLGSIWQKHSDSFSLNSKFLKISSFGLNFHRETGENFLACRGQATTQSLECSLGYHKPLKWFLVSIRRAGDKKIY